MDNNARDEDQPRCSKSLKLKRRRVDPQYIEVFTEEAQASSDRRRVDEYIEMSTEEPKESSDRFSFETTVEELELFKELQCPENTAKNNDWALRALSHGDQQEISSTLLINVLQICL